LTTRKNSNEVAALRQSSRREAHWPRRRGFREALGLALEVMDGKAMVVCMSRRICYELYEAIRKLRPDSHHKDDDKG